MRYPRNVKIFRGGVDAAPFAGLFFATVLFMVLFYSHVFFPGVPVGLGVEEDRAELSERMVRVLRDGTVRFLGEAYETGDLKEEIRGRVQRGELPKRVVLEAEAGADEKLVRAVESLLKDAGVGIKLPGERLDLPDDAGFMGTANPVVVVGVNLNGQIFFQHQRIDEAELQMKLAEVVEKSGEGLTLVLQADKNVPYERIIDVGRVARKAGVKRVVLGTRPGLG
jgi:biopolymer transport protein ExbD